MPNCLVCEDMSNRYGLMCGVDLTDQQSVDWSCRTDWGKFYNLASMDNPGLTEEEFLGLFVKCDSCALINTHLLFNMHDCSPQMADDSNVTDPRRPLDRAYAEAGT